MSTFYGLRCVTCNKLSGAGTKQTDFLAELVRLAPEIHALLEKDTHNMIQVTASLGNYHDHWADEVGEEDTIYDWVARHAGHEIVLRDEYGHESPLLLLSEK